MASEKTLTEDCCESVSEKNVERSLIVMCAPSVKEKYYKSKFVDIIDFLSNLANLVIGKDEVIILADDQTLPYFQGKVPSNILLQANIEDIWIRDFSPVIPSKQVKFRFSPSYLSRSDSKEIDKSFNNWLVKYGVDLYGKSDIILDGGNVVDNAAGTRVIVTDRILRDNPTFTKLTAKEKLKEILGVNQVAIIPEPPDDTTGHADGFVMWPTDKKIFLMKTIEPYNTQILHELESSFPGVEIVEIADYIPQTKWKDFSSAQNCFVNCLVTDAQIYMPTFNDLYDTEMIQLFRSHTDKTIVPVAAEKVSMMGGSVRCLTWQIKGYNSTKILQMKNSEEASDRN